MSLVKSATLLSILLLSTSAFARKPDGHDKNPRTSEANSPRGSHDETPNAKPRATSSHSSSRVVASIHWPAVSLVVGPRPYVGALWVDGYHDHFGHYHAGYWRPHARHGWVWIDGYRNVYGHWVAGYWARR